MALLVPKKNEILDLFISEVLDYEITLGDEKIPLSGNIYPISLCDDFLTNTGQLLLLFRIDNDTSKRNYSTFKISQSSQSLDLEQMQD